MFFGNENITILSRGWVGGLGVGNGVRMWCVGKVDRHRGYDEVDV